VMAQQIKFTCDGCGAERKQANHWFTTRVKDDGIIIDAFDPFLDANGNYEHYCGESCLIARVSKFLAELKKKSDELRTVPV